jgi:hypothetical protein
MPIPGDVLPGAINSTGTGGILVAAEDAPAGSLINGPGQLQYGGMLVADHTSLLWGEITGWRSVVTDYNDSPLPNSHGDRAGSSLAQGLVVTFDCQLVPDLVDISTRALAVATIEYHTRVQDVEIPLVVNDGAGIEFRMARVISRELPDTIISRLGADRASIQFKCADPRRYSLTPRSLRLGAPSSVGGLNYTPGLNYSPGLNYGTTTATGQSDAVNTGNVESPIMAILYGPMIRPRLRVGDRLWTLDISLIAGETVTIDGRTGQVLLNGLADRSQTLTDSSDLLDSFAVPPGTTTATLTTDGGDGFATLSWYDARM